MMIICIAGFYLNAADDGEKIESIFKVYFKRILEVNPEFLASLGIDDSFGISMNRDRLTDLSISALDREMALKRQTVKSLLAIPEQPLNPSQRLARKILLLNLQNRLTGEPYRYHAYLINPMLGVHISFTNLMIENHPINDRQDATDYIARLHAFGKKIDQVLTILKIKREKKLFPPKAIIKRQLITLVKFVKVPEIENPLFTHFKHKVQGLKKIEESERESLLRLVLAQMKQTVYPAYYRYITFLKELYAISDDRLGVWRLPDGDNYYEYCLKSHTSDRYTPEMVFQIGMSEVKRIRRETVKILRKSGIKHQSSLSSMLKAYWKRAARKNPSDLYYRNSKFGKKRAIADFKSYLKKVDRLLPKYFSLRPRQKVDVRAVPDFKSGAMGAHYSRASLDGRRKGVFYVNTVRPPFKPSMQTLALHEGLPGHHFQIAIQQESKENRLFRNLFFFTAFVEGWALYAERLGMEHGWFENEYSKIGYLNSEMLRAVRLVLDTGIHYKKWDRQRCLDFMQENLGWASNGSINRYAVWPGQACAYKIGELKILELREKAKTRLGKRFKLKEFHKAILRHGSVPLKILEEIVDQYIIETSNGN